MDCDAHKVQLIHISKLLRQAVNPAQVRGYLQRAFKDKLSAVQSAMHQLAHAYPPEEAGKRGYDLYVDFRWDMSHCVAFLFIHAPTVRVAAG